MCMRDFVCGPGSVSLTDTIPLSSVLNGDLITGESMLEQSLFVVDQKVEANRMEDTFRENSTSLIDEIVAPLNEAKIPFSSTHGVSYPITRELCAVLIGMWG